MMKNTLSLITILVMLSSFVSKDNIYIIPREIGIIENCEGNEAVAKIEIRTNSEQKIAICSFELDNIEFTLRANGKELSKSDVVYLDEENPLAIELKYTIPEHNRPSHFKFMTDLPEYLENTVQLNYGAFFIMHKDIQEAEEQVFNLTESCNDSIRVHFPRGGTRSSATLYKDSISTDSPYRRVSYLIMDEGNYLTFSREDIGRYYVRYMACHWGNNFWLRIK